MRRPAGMPRPTVRRARQSQDAVAAARGRGRLVRSRSIQTALHRAAAALHRGLAGEVARGQRHRPPSTYSSIVETIQARRTSNSSTAVSPRPRSARPSTTCCKSISRRHGPEYTASMERELDLVEERKTDWVDVLRDVLRSVQHGSRRGRAQASQTRGKDEPTDDICEKCGRPMVIKSGRFGRFISCSGYPECKTTKPILKDTGALCPIDGGKWSSAVRERGRTFYGCANYPACDFVSWDRVVPERVPVCGSYVVAKAKRGVLTLQCPADKVHDTARSGRTRRGSRGVGPAVRMTAPRSSAAGWPAAKRRGRPPNRRRRGPIFEHAPAPPGARALKRRSGGTRLQQLAARRGARKRRRPAQRGTATARFADRYGGAREPPCRPAERSPSTAIRFAAAVESRLKRIRAFASFARRLRRSILDGRPSSRADRCRPRSFGGDRRAAGARLRARWRAARLHYYDAASPIVAADSLDQCRCIASHATRRATATTISTSRSIASSTRSSCATCANCRATSPKSSNRRGRGRVPYFEGCLPIEEMADRGDDVLRFGPIKPVGLRHPGPACPHAVVQLRKENVAGTAYNLVGFQTRLTWPAQKEAFGSFRARECRMAALRRHAPQLVHRRAPPARRRLRLRGARANCSPARSPVPRLRRGGGLRLIAGSGAVRAGASRRRNSRPNGARRRRRAFAKHGVARLPAGQRHLGTVPAAPTGAHPRQARAAPPDGRARAGPRGRLARGPGRRPPLQLISPASGS